ncbi:MAG: glycosyltransferase family 39 protein [candidate division WOR-3 bacterium]
MLAGLANYSNRFLFADHWPAPGLKGQPTGFFRLPGWPEHQFRYFPLWWLLLGLPLLLFGIGLFYRPFRRAVVAPWRSVHVALPLVLTLAVFAFSLTPWDFLIAKPHETGAALMLYLYLASAGFTLFILGAWPALKLFDRPLTHLYNWLMALRPQQFLLLCFGFTLLVTNLISYFVFEHLPHIQDSIAQLFQARVFASGRLFLPSPNFPDFFDYTHIINNGRWYSQYPFLHSLILVPGVLIGMPWLINPLLGSLAIVTLYLLGRELFDERTGRLAAALGCFTPFILNMSAEFMNHASALLFTTLFMLYYFRTLSRSHGKVSLSPPILAGLFLGLVANIRPYTGLLVGLPFGIYGLAQIIRNPRRSLFPFSIMLVCAAAVTGLLLIYNWLTNGHPLLFGYVVKWGPGHELGFGKSGWGPQHTPYKGLLDTGNNFNLIQKFLFEWPIPSLLPAAFLFAGGKADYRDWLLVGTFLTLILGHYFYWFHNVCFGPRFLYESSTALVLLTVRGAAALPLFLERTFSYKLRPSTFGQLMTRLTPVLFLIMAGNGLPPLLARYHTYGGFDGTLLRTVKKAGLKDALVFCRHLGPGYTANALGLNGPVVYAKDFGLLNAALTSAYPDRAYYFASHDTLKPIPEIAYPRSELKRCLEEMANFLRDSISLDQIKTVIWPFLELPPQLSTDNKKITDFRTVSREIFTRRQQLQDFLPAISCWAIRDVREHLRLFSLMDDLQSFVAADCKWTLLKITKDGIGAIYEIRNLSGNEVIAPSQ